MILAMEEIKVYRSVWKYALAISCAALAVVCGILVLDKNPFKAWGIILLIGGGGLYMTFLLIRERVMDRPYLIIAEKKVIVSAGWKTQEINFSDVEAFSLVGKNIRIKYKVVAEVRECEDSNWLSNLMCDFLSTGCLKSIAAADLTIYPQPLCDLLNERLAKANRVEKSICR